MTPLSVTIPTFLVVPLCPESAALSTPVVSRHGIQVGSQVPYVEQDGMHIFPRQWVEDVHWTCVQFKPDERPTRQLYVETWRLLEIVMRSLRMVPHGWEADFAGVADDVELDWWLRGLVGAP